MERKIWIPVQINKREYLGSICSYGTTATMFPPGTGVSHLDFTAQRRILREVVFPKATWEDAIVLLGPSCILANVVAAWASNFGEARVLVYKHSVGKFVEKRIPR